MVSIELNNLTYEIQFIESDSKTFPNDYAKLSLKIIDKSKKNVTKFFNPQDYFVELEILDNPEQTDSYLKTKDAPAVLTETENENYFVFDFTKFSFEKLNQKISLKFKLFEKNRTSIITQITKLFFNVAESKEITSLTTKEFITKSI
ncbi:uncharacterized protein ASCRUDRAFT_71189 [Ascoidea rubescens DSM 1968]|uniref:Uncharacterized protein n=1 Tax=Ascoidea rubescens DSM 1968 TaxID=1344418 RepID=A0A1D2VEV9_9ASCO|nr:hypothetical protein ASCRUDRAFT_71189 [Ascoidea rubescens DSM 1968]ODV60155.1 hypothetical protein ASCRUDRAFT_71189 [Ascoidea rubescens DSM 1968]